MSKTIQHKRSSVAGNQPSSSQISVGELAINFADRSIFTKDGSDNVIELSRDVIRSDVEPSDPLKGDLWFNTTTKELFLYDGTSFQDIGSDTGEAVEPANTTSVPPFVGGTGSESDPFILSSVSLSSGDQNVTLATITITDLGPNQSVPFQDLNSVTNAGRFGVNNTTADSNGDLVSVIKYSDNPTTISATNYAGQLKFGNSSVFINSEAFVSEALGGGTIINNPDGTGNGTNIWNGSDGSALTASGDLLLSTDGVSFSVSISVDNGDIFYIKWAGDPGSGTGIDGAHGTTISGSITDNNSGKKTLYLTIDKEATFEFQVGVDSDQALSSVSTSNPITLSDINSYVYPYGSNTGGSSPMYSKNGGSYLALPTSNAGDAVHYAMEGDVIDLRHTNASTINTESTTTLNMASDSATYTTTTANLFPTVATPSITAPATDGETGISVTPTFTSSAFAMAYGTDSHQATSWELVDVVGAPIETLDSDTSALESWNPSTALSSQENYQVRVRYHSAGGLTSAWSNFRTFTVEKVLPGGTWSQLTGLVSLGRTFRQVGYSASLGWVAVGSNTNPNAAYSPDGTNWTAHSTPNIGIDWNDITSYGGMFYIVGGISELMTSTNGTTWVDQSSAVVAAIASSSLKGVSTGRSNTIAAVGGSAKTITAVGGTATFSRQSYPNHTCVAICSHNSLNFVALGDNGEISNSVSGTGTSAWSNRIGNVGFSNAKAITSNTNNVLIAVGANGGCATSPNGTSWTTVTDVNNMFPNETLNDVIYTGTNFIIVGTNGACAISNDKNGTSWTQIDLGTTEILFSVHWVESEDYGIVVGNQTFAAISYGATHT
jgi:hypothetical protein